jgi:CRP-like cAMP-binding protein
MKSLRRTPSKRNRLLSSLSPTEYARIEPLLEPVELERREVISSAGRPIPYAVFPEEAVTSTVMELPEGEVVEVGLMGIEGLAGHGLLYGTSIAFTTVIVQVPGPATRMRAEDFQRAIVEHGGEAYRLWLRYAHAFLGMVSQVAGCNASHGVEQRFARWLLMIHDRIDQDVFPLTHEFAALLLSVRRATVTEVATNLRIAGAIDYRNGQMQIRDRHLLENVACGCYGAIVEITESVFKAA